MSRRFEAVACPVRTLKRVWPVHCTHLYAHTAILPFPLPCPVLGLKQSAKVPLVVWMMALLSLEIHLTPHVKGTTKNIFLFSWTDLRKKK